MSAEPRRHPHPHPVKPYGEPHAELQRHPPVEPYIRPAGRAECGARPEVVLAERQYGVLTRAQLHGCGWSDSAVDRAVGRGRLRRLYPSVYALGHAMLVTDGRRLAAALACGPAGQLGEHDAGAVHELCTSRGGRFTIIVPHGRARTGRLATIHVRESRLTADDVTVVRGLPVTSVARTIVDIAARTPGEAEDVIDAAMQLGVYDQRAMDRQLATSRRGVGVVRRVLAERHPDSHATKSRWERRMLRLLGAHGLPRPLVNPPLLDLGLEPDLLWPAQMLVVEWDSWTHHRARARFEADRRKTVRLQTAGYTVLRFTWRQTQDEPEVVVAAIRAALAPPTPRRAPHSARPAGGM